MKKCLAVLLSALLLMTTMVVGVSAEEFDLQETNRQQADSAFVLLTWNLADAPTGTKVNEIIIGGQVCPFKDGVQQSNVFTVDLTQVPTGLYTRVTYGYTVNGAQKSKVVTGAPIATAGNIDVTLEASFTAQGKLIVKAVDANDEPARGYAVELTLEGMPEKGTTNAQGVYESVFSVSEGKQATFKGVVTRYKETALVYNPAEQKSLTRSVSTTTAATVTGDVTTTTTVTEETTTAGETTTTEQAVDATTQSRPSTTATVKGDSTTALEDGMVATNALTDTALLETFGLSRSEFLSKARLLFTEAHYTALVGRTGNVPVLSVRTSTAEITPTMVQQALSNVSEFSSYAEDQRQVVTFDLSLLMTSRSGKDVPVTALPDDILYTVQLPIPTEMKKCATYAITVMDGDGLMAPQKLDVKNGMFELQINSLEAYTLIGFGTEDENGAGGISWRLIVLLVAGLWLIGGAGALLYFFVFRKPDETAPTDENDVQPGSPEDNDTDIFSGRSDTENVWEPEDN